MANAKLIPTIEKEQAEHFWTRVSQPEEGCWEWSGCLSNKGYGRVRVRRVEVPAHRLAYELSIGPVSKDLCVLHACDNRRCCRPDHLFLGTILDNNRDMWAKGRARPGRATGDRSGSRRHPESRPRGEGHPHAKLTWELVREIRRKWVAREATQTSMARDHGVRQCTISEIVRGLIWREQPCATESS